MEANRPSISTFSSDPGAVLDVDYQVTVPDQFVSADNDALFKCQVAPSVADIFQVVAWLEDNTPLVHVGGSPQLPAGQPAAQVPAKAPLVARHPQASPTGEWLAGKAAAGTRKLTASTR